jgi:hypothetical protein
MEHLLKMFSRTQDKQAVRVQLMKRDKNQTPSSSPEGVFSLTTAKLAAGKKP